MESCLVVDQQQTCSSLSRSFHSDFAFSCKVSERWYLLVAGMTEWKCSSKQNDIILQEKKSSDFGHALK